MTCECVSVPRVIIRVHMQTAYRAVSKSLSTAELNDELEF